jgi:hypothetical protein
MIAGEDGGIDFAAGQGMAKRANRRITLEPQLPVEKLRYKSRVTCNAALGFCFAEPLLAGIRADSMWPPAWLQTATIGRAESISATRSTGSNAELAPSVPNDVLGLATEPYATWRMRL